MTFKRPLGARRPPHTTTVRPLTHYLSIPVLGLNPSPRYPFINGYSIFYFCVLVMVLPLILETFLEQLWNGKKQKESESVVVVKQGQAHHAVLFRQNKYLYIYI